MVGLGPAFRLRLQLNNAGSRAVSDATLVLSYNSSQYSVDRPLILVPVLVPTLAYEVEVAVQCLDPLLPADSIRVFVSLVGSAVPLITAVVNMPQSEQPLAE